MNNKTKNYYLFSVISTVVIVGLAGCAMTPIVNKYRSDISKTIDRYCGSKFSNNDLDGGNCVIPITEMFSFAWDKMYVFDFPVDDQDIEKVIGIPFSSSNPAHYSKKWLFILDNKIVYFEENIIEQSERPTSAGDVDFEITSLEIKYSRYGRDALFQVARQKIRGGESLLLHCLNCKKQL